MRGRGADVADNQSHWAWLRRAAAKKTLNNSERKLIALLAAALEAGSFRLNGVEPLPESLPGRGSSQYQKMIRERDEFLCSAFELMDAPVKARPRILAADLARVRANPVVINPPTYEHRLLCFIKFDEKLGRVTTARGIARLLQRKINRDTNNRK